MEIFRRAKKKVYLNLTHCGWIAIYIPSQNIRQCRRNEFERMQFAAVDYQ